MVKQSLLTLIIVFVPINIFSQWEWYNPYPTGNNLKDVYFVDQNNGFLVSEFGEYFETNDGGENWIRKDIGS